MIRMCGFFFLSVVIILPALAQNAQPPKEPLRFIEVIGGQFEYDINGQILEITHQLDERPSLIVRDQTITADRIHYDVSTHILSATGTVSLWDRGMILRGDSMELDVVKNEGVLYNLKSSELTDDVFFEGKQLLLGHQAGKIPKGATEPVQLRRFTLLDGSVTSNDLPIPHYRIEYDKITVTPNVRATAHQLVFYANDFPLFYFPVMSKSLSENELTYFVDIDHYSNLGTTFLNRVQWKPNDQWITNLYGDFYTDAGIGKGAKLQMDLPGEYGPEGMLYAYHINQQAPDNDRIFDGRDRFNLALEYEQDLPYDMRLSAEGHRFSDSEYRWDYRASERARLIDVVGMEQDSVSHLNLSKWWDNQSLRATLATRFDPFYYSGLPFVERKPQLHFEQYPYPILDTNLFVDLRADYGRYRREEGVTFPLNQNQLFSRTTFVDEVDRLDAELRLAYPFHLPYRFTVKPWVGYRGTQYSDPSRAVGFPLTTYNFDDESRLMLEGGVDISTRKVYEFDPFLDRFSRMRAVIEPVLQYGYFHPDTDLEELSRGPGVRFPYIDPVDDFRFKMHRLSSLLRTKIQGKTSGGITQDFMRLSAGVVYDLVPDDNLRFDNFEFFDDMANDTGQRFSDLVQDFSIYPYDWLTVGNSLQYDVDDSEVRSLYAYSQFRPIDPVHVTVGYLTFKHPLLDTEEQQDITFNINWELSDKWQVYYTSWYDIDDESFRRNYIGFMRDMYDFYGLVQVGYRRHPTLGDDFNISVGLQFWGIGKKKHGAISKSAIPTTYY